MEPYLQQATVVQYTGKILESGQFHGHGKAVFNSGQVYEGDWQHGHMDGLGKLICPDGVCYEGSLVSDKIIGRGVYHWSNAIYKGDVLNGLRHGYGTLTFTDSPVVYEGEWQHGKRHGRAVLYYDADRASYYEGEWQNDMKHGQGTSLHPSGNSYSGSWACDKREGPGTMAWSSKGQMYTGMWANNLPNGFGEHVWLQGTPALQAANHAMHLMFNRYRGMFQNGKRHGQGALLYSNGARYEGQWDSDRKQGSGVYVFEDGTVFAGQFAADRPVLQSGRMFGAANTIIAATAADRPEAMEAAAAAVPAAAAGEASGTDLASFTAGKPLLKAASTALNAAAVEQTATKAGPESAVATATLSSPEMVEEPLGFGPRISSPQLYIADMLQEYDSPPVTYKAVSNLLLGCNTELRTLYDRYCNRLSPVLDPSEQRNSWVLQAGQVWELLKDSHLLCRHMQLQHVCELLQPTLEPPQPVLDYRQQVLSTPDAVAVLRQPQQLFDPAVELLFRDFCELLVRISAMRYPQLPCLEQQLQQMLMQHLLPLLGSTGRQGGGRQSIQTRASLLQMPSGAAGSGVAAALPAGAAVSATEQLMQQDNLVMYLQTQAQTLHQLFAVFAGSGCGLNAAAATAGPAAFQHEMMQQQEDSKEQDQAETLWAEQAVTVRQVVNVFQQAGLLQQWQMDACALAAVLMEGALSVQDPEGLRARLDDINLEPPDDLDAQQQANQQAAAHQELLFWMDAPLLYVEVLWGLVRCAATLPLDRLWAQQDQQLQPTDELQDQQHAGNAYTVWGQASDCAARTRQHADLVARVQALLEGHGGLFEAVLGMHTAAADACQQQCVEEQSEQGTADKLQPVEQQQHEDAAVTNDDTGLDAASAAEQPADLQSLRLCTAATDSSAVSHSARPQLESHCSMSPRAVAGQCGTPCEESY